MTAPSATWLQILSSLAACTVEADGVSGERDAFTVHAKREDGVPITITIRTHRYAAAPVESSRLPRKLHALQGGRTEKP